MRLNAKPRGNWPATRGKPSPSVSRKCLPRLDGLVHANERSSRPLRNFHLLAAGFHSTSSTPASRPDSFWSVKPATTTSNHTVTRNLAPGAADAKVEKTNDTLGMAKSKPYFRTEMPPSVHCESLRKSRYLPRNQQHTVSWSALYLFKSTRFARPPLSLPALFALQMSYCPELRILPPTARLSITISRVCASGRRPVHSIVDNRSLLPCSR